MSTSRNDEKHFLIDKTLSIVNIPSHTLKVE